MSLNKRLNDLEQAARPAGAIMVAYEDLDQAGIYWQRSPFSSDPGQRYTDAEIEALNLETFITVRFVKDWRDNDGQLGS